MEEEEGMERERKAKDGIINGEGKKLLEWVEENGWGIFNGCIKGDEEGEYTFTGGKGNTIIDFVLEDEDVRREIENMRIGDRIDSDHHPIEVKIKGKRGRKCKKNKEEREWRGIWDKEGRCEFRRKMGEIEKMRIDNLGEQWREMEERVNGALREVEEERKEENKLKRQRGWWDEECREEKKKVKKMLREWRGGRRGRKNIERVRKNIGNYVRKRRRKRLKNGRGKWKAREEKVMVWEIVNRERKGRKRVKKRMRV